MQLEHNVHNAAVFCESVLIN